MLSLCVSVAPIMRAFLYAMDLTGFRAKGIKYDKCVNATQILPDLFKKIDSLRKDIFIYFDKVDTQHHGEAYGNHFGARPFIIIGKDFANLMDPHALGFIYKHEIGHLYFNDGFKQFFTCLMTAIVTSFVAHQVLPTFSEPSRLPIAILGMLISTILTCTIEFVHASINERNADKFAIQHSSDKELIGGMHFFSYQTKIAEQICQIVKKTLPDPLKQSITPKLPHWFVRWTDPHPSNHKRVENIQKELKKRKIDTVTQNDQKFSNIRKNVRDYFIQGCLKSLKPLEDLLLDHSKWVSTLVT